MFDISGQQTRVVLSNASDLYNQIYFGEIPL